MTRYYQEDGCTCRGIKFRDEDDAYDYFRQREIDEMNPRNAAGMSPEELLIQDAFMEGQRAGNLSVAAGCNPYADPKSPEYQAWERGRFGAIGVRMAGSVA